MGSVLSWEEALSLCSAMVAQLPDKPLFPHWCEPCFFEGAISPLTPGASALCTFPIVTRRGACLAVRGCVPGTLHLGAQQLEVVAHAGGSRQNGACSRWCHFEQFAFLIFEVQEDRHLYPGVPTRKPVFKQLSPKVITKREAGVQIDTTFDSDTYEVVEHGCCIWLLRLANFLDITAFGKVAKLRSLPL